MIWLGLLLGMLVTGVSAMGRAFWIWPLLGAVLGYLLDRIRKLEARLDATQPAPQAATPPTPASPTVVSAPMAAEPVMPRPEPIPVAASLVVPGRAAAVAVPKVARRRPDEVDESSPQITSSVAQTALAWLKGGNTIVRVAILILFVGVAFLVRYAAEHVYFPIELRFIGIALLGLGLVVVGRRLFDRRPGYAVSLQGGGIGIMYLTVFAAYRLYHLLPPALTFPILLVLVFITTVLSLWQNALPLAVLGFAGGFLAPVLASTGSGSYVVLFSYYFILNIGIAWISMRQVWRVLNLMGFAFTFVIAGIWGAKLYQPEFFATTEPFLIAHVALYLFVLTQYAYQVLRADLPAKALYVDGTLLFGMPLAAFGLQAVLVKDMPYGVAISSAVLAFVYLVLGRWLWSQNREKMRFLTEGFFALGLIFFALVVPLVLDVRWTSVAWAVEGAGIVWLSIRQGRRWMAGFGFLLQLAALVSLWLASFNAFHFYARLHTELPFFNTIWLGIMIVVFAGLFAARALDKAGHTDPVWAGWRVFAWIWFGYMLLHWLGFGLREASWIAGLIAGVDARTARVAWLVLTAALLEGLYRPLAWPVLSAPARALAPMLLWGLLVAGFLSAAQGDMGHYGYWLWSQSGWLPSVLGAALAGVILWRRDHDGRSSQGWEHVVAFWLLAWLGASLLGEAANHLASTQTAWYAAACLLVPFLLLRRAAGLDSAAWPRRAHPRAWHNGVLLTGLVLLAGWVLWSSVVQDGTMTPLLYLPIVNPVDIVTGLAAFLAWQIYQQHAPAKTTFLSCFAACGFIWVNAMVLRTVHQWGGVPFNLLGLWQSALVQVTLSILWTLLALLIMGVAAHKHARPAWLVGAILLAVTVLKLFLVDLGDVSGLARIVSFMGVGGLMLLIGYVAPLPPQEKKDA